MFTSITKMLKTSPFWPTFVNKVWIDVHKGNHIYIDVFNNSPFVIVIVNAVFMTPYVYEEDQEHILQVNKDGLLQMMPTFEMDEEVVNTLHANYRTIVGILRVKTKNGFLQYRINAILKILS